MMLLGTQRVNAAGHLEIGGCDSVDLAHEFGTPLFVMDEAAIRDNCRAYREAFAGSYGPSAVCYASKAFLSLAICRIVQDEGLRLDVASGGELFVALRAGFPAERINLHGNNKQPDELRDAVQAGVGHVVLDHFGEIAALNEVAAEFGRRQSVLVRSTPGVDPDTHRFMSTGQADTKFGFNIADGSALEAVKRVLGAGSLQFDGIHMHVGSQLLDTESHIGAVGAAVALMAAIRDTHGAVCRVLNMGGGLGIRYRPSHQPPSIAAFAAEMAAALRAGLDGTGLPTPTLHLEPGRSIVGECGTTLYTVGAIKTVPVSASPGTRTYAAVDGGLSDNPRPQMYGADYEVICANRARVERDRTTTIAGRHCETDVLVWDAATPDLVAGDTLAVLSTGAYNYAMASNYNRFRRPAVVLVFDGHADVIVRRESQEDLVRCEIIPERLETVGEAVTE